jgi:hypothetical protein
MEVSVARIPFTLEPSSRLTKERIVMGHCVPIPCIFCPPNIASLNDVP